MKLLDNEAETLNKHQAVAEFSPLVYCPLWRVLNTLENIVRFGEYYLLWRILSALESTVRVGEYCQLLVKQIRTLHAERYDVN